MFLFYHPLLVFRLLHRTTTVPLEDGADHNGETALLLPCTLINLVDRVFYRFASGSSTQFQA